jgi:hypothetical protein
MTWMLSSLLQQTGNIPNLIVNVSYTEQDKSLSSSKVCSFFKKQGLNIKETVLEEYKILNRSLARNIQLEESGADWILFADCDMVYSIDFFEDIKVQLENDFKDVDKVIGADRVSLQIEYCSKFFNEEDEDKYPFLVENVANFLKDWPIYYIRGKRTAAGYFQLAKVSAIREKVGKYSGTHRDNPRRYKADRGFRCLMGGRVPMDVKQQYHLNHTRDCHLKQR